MDRRRDGRVRRRRRSARLGTTWSLEAELTAVGESANDVFGWSVAANGDTLVVGAPGSDAADWEAGAAYVFERSGGVWTQSAELGAPAANAHDLFGRSVAIDGDRVLVGAPGRPLLLLRRAGLRHRPPRLRYRHDEPAVHAAAGDRAGGYVVLPDVVPGRRRSRALHECRDGALPLTRALAIGAADALCSAT
ncbi:MAG: hypothetical protein GY711_12720 [bacterium]|nr:hypothetical protein [bacterium]